MIEIKSDSNMQTIRKIHLDDPSNVSLDDPSNEQTNHEEAQINLLNNLIRRDDYPKRDAAYHDRLSTFQDFPQNCPGSQRRTIYRITVF